MRWSDERYVRVYTRDTVDWQSLSFDAQALLVLLLRKVDRAGLLPLGKHGKRGVAIAIGHPREWPRLEPALEELLADGCIRMLEDGRLFVPNYIDAQEAKSSDKARQQKVRELAQALAAAQIVTQRDLASHDVTESHASSQAVTADNAASHGVTPSRAVPCLAVPSLALPTSASQSAPPEASPQASGEELPDVTKHAEPRPPLVLTQPGKPKRKPREPSAAERLYAGLEEARRERCEKERVEFIPEAWAPARINANLGPLAKATGPEADRLNDAFAEFLSDHRGVDFDPPWSLGMFLVRRSQYESKAVRAAGGAA